MGKPGSIDLVNDAVTGADAERRLALSYAPADRRSGVEALFALDHRLGTIVRRAREPLLGQMRLTWWREALAALDAAPAPAEPVLTALAATVLPHGVIGAALSRLADGWEIRLTEEPLGVALRDHAVDRGRTLFEAAGVVLGAAASDPVGTAGEGWALADIVRTRPGDAHDAAALARPLLAQALGVRWSRPARALGALAHLARLDLDGTSRPGAPARVGRVLLHRLTGR